MRELLPARLLTNLLMFAAIALIAASCGGSDGPTAGPFGDVGDSSTGAASEIDGVSQAELDVVLDRATGGTGEAGAIEISGDATCPVIATDALQAVVGGEPFNRATFEEFRERNTYFCEWSGPGAKVELVVSQLTDIRDLDSPTYFDELSEASSEKLEELLGPIGSWPEVWKVDRTSTTYVFGQFVYEGRGTPEPDTATCFPDARSRMSSRVLLALDFSALDEAGHTELAREFFASADDSFIPMQDNFEC